MTDLNQKKQEILDGFQFRHATKAFDPSKKISAEDFAFILEAGRLSPSSYGLEPWKFVVVQDPELRERLRQVSGGAQGQLPTASHFVVILARKNVRYDSDYIAEHLHKVKKLPEDIVELFSNAIKGSQESKGMLEREDGLFEWSCKQTYIALGNMMTVAAQLAIDSCPIEGFDTASANRILEEEGLLEDGQLGVAVMAAFGYRAEEPRPKTRREMDQVVKWVE